MKIKNKYTEELILEIEKIKEENQELKNQLAEKDKDLKFRINVADEIASWRKSDWSKIKKLEKQNDKLKKEISELKDNE